MPHIMKLSNMCKNYTNKRRSIYSVLISFIKRHKYSSPLIISVFLTLISTAKNHTFMASPLVITSSLIIFQLNI